MDFGEAISALKAGMRVCRKGGMERDSTSSWQQEFRTRQLTGDCQLRSQSNWKCCYCFCWDFWCADGMVSITGRYVGRRLDDFARESQRVKGRKKHDYQRNEAFSKCSKEKSWQSGTMCTRMKRLMKAMFSSCGSLQDITELQVLAATTVSGDGIYAEYTYNGDAQELYEDVYKKLTNTHYTEE